MEEEDEDIAAAAVLTKGAVTVALIHSILNGADCQEKKLVCHVIDGQN